MYKGKVKRAFKDRNTGVIYRPGQPYESTDLGRMEELAGKGCITFKLPTAKPTGKGKTKKSKEG